MERQDIGIIECWNDGTIKHWNIGMMEYWQKKQ
jgi:hypothetical protein